MGCQGAGEPATITIATNDDVLPGPRASLVVMVLTANPPTPWQLLILIQTRTHMAP